MRVEGLEEGPGCPSRWLLNTRVGNVLIVDLSWKLLVDIFVMKQYGIAKQCPETLS